MGIRIPNEYEGSVCEIKTTDNAFITTARIASLSSDKVKLSVKNRAVKSLAFGTRIKINIINSKLGFRAVEGSVFTYSFGELTVTDVYSIAESERRKSLRVYMNAFARAVFDSDVPGKKAHAEIIVKDMSMNGVKFISRQHFDMGTALLFTLDLGRRKYMEISCTVIRRGSESTGEGMCYIARLNNPAGREDEICSFLLQKQGELYNMAR
ncbi:PilZ domain-containing protein [Ruminococcus sp. HUN007]|uniref:PilZ domain-containing protein n=1 Tax=Ruminococcus sp. HUN007 TaxID=1514668 RepID=UPI0005D1C4AD|nr:PilZ domain-containing protein [Ruminococcus sp. HUN007]